MRNFMRLSMVSTTVLAVALGVAACGEDKKDEAEDPGLKAEVFKFSEGKAEVTFAGAAVDQQFVLLPISVGDPNSILGADETTAKYKFDGVPAGGSLRRVNSKPRDFALTSLEREHGMRTLLNRFDPTKGMNQGAWFWTLANRIDSDSTSNLFESGLPGPVERYFRKAIKPTSRLTSALTADGDCPVAGGDVTIMDIEDTSETDVATIPAGGVVSGADYCIVYLSEPKTGGTRAEVEDSIKTIISRYKNVIYKSDFPVVNGYTFKPVFVVMDFGNATIWPQSQQISGAFVGAMATETKMPMLYMAADLKAVSPYKEQANYDAAAAKLGWHATLAHEMQHAIIDYFRVRATTGGIGEVPSIDEGLAHYMEDLFGYGSEQFGGVSKAFLDTWATNSNAPINATESGLIERGGAETFLYYLTSQKGGLKFTDGVVSGGGGLDLIVELVKNAGGKRGPANLNAKMGGDWLATVSNYFGALVLDGGDLKTNATLTVQDPQAIADLNGHNDKTFGMRFNGFGGRDKSYVAGWESKVGTTAEVEGSYYQTTPVIYTVKDPAASVKLTTDQDAANTAVIKVRVK